MLLSVCPSELPYIAMDQLPKYTPYIMRAIRMAVCPDLAPEYFNTDALVRDLALPLETYVKALLHQPKPDEDIVASMEHIIQRRVVAKFSRIFAAHSDEQRCNRKSIEDARYFVKMRHAMDLKEETRGQPVPPQSIWVSCFQTVTCDSHTRYEWFQSINILFPAADSTSQVVLDELIRDERGSEREGLPFRLFLNKSWDLIDENSQTFLSSLANNAFHVYGNESMSSYIDDESLILRAFAIFSVDSKKKKREEDEEEDELNALPLSNAQAKAKRQKV